jgi:PAS domain S-box-containing protein
MSKSGPPPWLSKQSAISRYAVAILSVAAAAVAAQILTVFLHTEPIASSMISAVMFAAWFGGFGPGLLAITLALLAFHYYVVPPVNSFTLKHDLFSLGLQELPRLFLFSIAALFVVFLSATQRRAVESLRRSRDDLLVAARTQGEIAGALRESEQRFRDFTESASDWYWETGPDHRFITVSEQQLDIIGALPTRRLGTLRWEFARDFEEEPEKWRRHIADLDAHKPFRDFRYRAAGRDGSEIYITTSGKPLFDRQGRFLGYRGVSGHITAAVRAAQLEEALQEAKVVGDNIAHDLRTPLTRVRIRLERGREHATTLEEFRAVADQAIAGLDQSLTTITALLRITEIEHGRRREGFGEVGLAPLIREAADLYEPIAENKGVTLRVDAADGPIVKGDRDLLFEAVANLVDNAVKFTPEGGRVELALLLQDSEIVIRVSDTGPGIPEIEREAVTQRFYRSDQTRNIKGLGLGLSMVAAIIKLHSFRLKISAAPGCTAEIACPLAD